MSVPYIYWNNIGDFKRAPRFCVTGLNYGAHFLVDNNGVCRKRPDLYNYTLGRSYKPNYPVPAVLTRIDCLTIIRVN